jgi:hypothetical protein
MPSRVSVRFSLSTRPTPTSSKLEPTLNKGVDWVHAKAHYHPNSGKYSASRRQQWNFSPPGAIREVEEYQVELSNVTVLELVIKPNIGGGLARASLKNLRLS